MQVPGVCFDGRTFRLLRKAWFSRAAELVLTILPRPGPAALAQQPGCHAVCRRKRTRLPTAEISRFASFNRRGSPRLVFYQDCKLEHRKCKYIHIREEGSQTDFLNSLQEIMRRKPLF